jgi:tyrosinase
VSQVSAAQWEEFSRALAFAGKDEEAALDRLCWMSRRGFLKLSVAAIATLGLPSFGLSACTPEQLQELIDQIRNRPVRKDINTLDPSDPILENLRAAITHMQGLPSSDNRSWAAQAAIHGTVAGGFNRCTHGNWLFLPWHRAYLYYFEEICREFSGDDSFGLPYWNWTANPQVPAVFWTSGDPLFHSPRSATSSSTANASIVGATNINNILGETNFLIFASGSIDCTVDQTVMSTYGDLEGGPHNYIHGFVGGTMGTGGSPLDPIFWTHHNRIEELWVEWNINLGNPNTNSSDWTCRSFTEFVDRNGNPATISVPTTLLLPLLSYRFDTQV